MKQNLIAMVLLAAAGLTNGAIVFETGFDNLSGWTAGVDPAGVLELSTFAAAGTAVASYRIGDNGADNIINTLTRTIDTTGFTNITLNLTAFQHTGTWEGPEYLLIEIDTGAGFTPLLQDFEVWNGTPGLEGSAGNDGNPVPTPTGPLALPAAADNGSFVLRITMASGFFANGGSIGSSSEVYYLDHLIIAEQSAPPPSTQLLVNPGFEMTPFPSGWTSAAGTVSTAGFDGSAIAARLPWNTLAALSQSIATAQSNFTVRTLFQVAGNTTDTGFRILLETEAGPAVEVQTVLGGYLQLLSEGSSVQLISTGSGSAFAVPANKTLHLQITGRDFGTATAQYDVAWSDPGSLALTHAVTGVTHFSSRANAAAAGIITVRFDRTASASHSYLVDDVTLDPTPAAVPDADHALRFPLPDKVVCLSGIYPHLAVSNNEAAEVGIGAVVPWAGRLWAITYTGHAPAGSSDKLYEITPELKITTRSESIGGTPANRFIHTASQQLNIGPYFIDTNRTVRILPYSQAPGRPTATAAHLSDPANRLYIMTMENGIYDVNVHDLSFITRYPDRQGSGDRFLFGYHGKGLYSGQGQLVAANNGRPNLQNDPTGPAGVLASWNGTTVAANGGSYLAGNDPNNDSYKGTTLENALAPVTAQPEYIAGWSQHSKRQHCEVTGPGGIYGSSDPENDPLWATGFDDKSVFVSVMEDGANWHTWRLPKGSYSHDGSHGWHTEWPRIRQLDPTDPSSVYLMHMHGLFYDFPRTFSSGNFANLTPLCAYYKMPTDYCMFEGRLVIGKDDASLFSNPLTLRTQSNLWFGQLKDLQRWGAPHGHGGLWKNESLAAGTISEPFLVHGFAHITLHIRHTTAAAVTLELQSCSGDTPWSCNRTMTVAAGGYHAEILNSFPAQWIRLRAAADTTGLTAYLLLGNPWPHQGAERSEYVSLAEIGDPSSYSDGLLRVMAGSALELEVATAAADSSGATAATGYHIIGGPLQLNVTANSTAEAALRSAAATTKVFSADPASVWITDDLSGARLRLPRLHPEYDAPFPSGWARGIREVVTERSLLNCQGTFYEIPRSNSGGRYRMRPLTTHGRRITDFAAWRGLLVLTGVQDNAPASERLIRNPAGAALWLGEVDDLWQMGEPRGYGGPWLESSVSAAIPSDAYLMYGYDRKELNLSHTHSAAVTFTVEVDFLADSSWSAYTTLTVPAGRTLHYTFPAGFRAHWVRVISDTATTATAQFIYGPLNPTDPGTRIFVR